MIDNQPNRNILPEEDLVVNHDTSVINDNSKQSSSSMENEKKTDQPSTSNNILNQQKSPSLLTQPESVNVSPSKERLVLKRLPYSKSEQQQIVDYIIETKSFKFIKGNQLWQEMQKDQTVCKGRRTWQSMKENFHKQIVPQLHIYKNVNNKVANCFKRVLMGLTLDLDSVSNEEKENSPKKKETTKDKYAIQSDTSESESEITVPKKKIYRDPDRNTNKLSPSPRRQNVWQNDKKADYKARRKRRSLIIDDDSSEEEFDNLSSRSNPRIMNQPNPVAQVHNTHTKSIQSIEDNNQGNFFLYQCTFIFIPIIQFSP